MPKNSNSSSSAMSGFCSHTGIFQSLKPPTALPPETLPLTVAQYSLSLQLTLPWPNSSTALINSATGHRISYSDFTLRVTTLAASLQTRFGLSKGDTAFVLSPNSTFIPILYFSLLSIGVVISPANPISTDAEISRQIELSKPVIAFATSATRHKLPKLRYGTVVIDSPELESMTNRSDFELRRVEVEVSQSDVAAIIYSSGTTGQVKGVMLTHRNLISMVANYYAQKPERSSPAVILYTVPYFHVFGLSYCLKSVATAETVVVMERFEMRKMLKAVEEFRVSDIAVAPPVIVGMIKERAKKEDGLDLSSLRMVLCGGAPLGKEAIKAFTEKFPNTQCVQGYGLSESTGAVSRAVTEQEFLRWGSTGRLIPNTEAKIIDPITGNALPPGKQGELWVRGPTVMRGYVGDTKATAETLVKAAGGGGWWLRTGDICYFDENGFLFVVDRLKELIKYKGYQVAPAELEQLLQSHPHIIDAAVIPLALQT
ncbi:PREDICTED: 4-coumarate--CoA ligase-like 9 isoform X3 [Ipomoea nil]|uniref:4-coumarate--CoA ligase-like 9 isoform X3 n=1 Tax=Ipomoea nil TaxID=35883 RepID=UPI000901C4E1|nr:PREDICTED: 4-coumarate--CoA ligase-like 9 isoform X3 [Ipomoea nil]